MFSAKMPFFLSHVLCHGKEFIGVKAIDLKGVGLRKVQNHRIITACGWLVCIAWHLY